MISHENSITFDRLIQLWKSFSHEILYTRKIYIVCFSTSYFVNSIYCINRFLTVHKAVGRVTSDVSETSDNEEDEVTKFPWLKSVAMVMGSANFLCEHRDVCPPACIRRQTQNCAKFLSALKTIYSRPVSQLTQHRNTKSEGDKGRQCKLSTKELTIKEKEARDKIMITYIGEKVKYGFQISFCVMCKLPLMAGSTGFIVHWIELSTYLKPVAHWSYVLS